MFQDRFQQISINEACLKVLVVKVLDYQPMCRC